VVTDEPKPPDPPIPTGGSAIYARAGVLENTTALRSYLKEEKSRGFGTIVLEMKDEDGRLLYLSELPAVVGREEIVIGTLTAKQIVDICIEEGFKPIARINTLKDRLAPSGLGIAYGGWLDNTPANGGKRWSNPFSQGTIDYTAQITAELYEAGFADVIFANTRFPFDVFRGVDLTILPSEVTNSSTNFTGLAGFVNAVSEEVSDANLLLEISLSCFTDGNLSGTSAILRNGGNNLDVGGIVLIFNRGYFESPSVLREGSTIDSVVSGAFSAIAQHTGGLDIIPVLDGSEISENDRERIVEAFSANGFENFIIRN
jgi:hypothetical protein